MQFVSSDGRASHPFYFFKQLKHEAACTWQVLRSEFDQMLMDNAREKGAEVLEQVTVRETIQKDGYVTGREGRNRRRRDGGVSRADHDGRDRARRVLRDSQWVESARPLPEQDCDLDVLQRRAARSRHR